MRYFLIKQLEQYSGIKAHTIRTWELRFGLFMPARSASNIRLYTLPDLQRLLRLRLLLLQGHKLAKLAKLTDDEREALAADVTGRQLYHTHLVDGLLLSMLREDVDTFTGILDNHIATAGIDDTIEHLVIPFLEVAGLLWYSSHTSDVHFAVTAIRRKIIYALERKGNAHAQQRSALLFLPKDEHYDLVLLYLNYKLMLRNIKVLYLGTDICLANVEKVVAEKQPDILCTYVISPSPGGDDYAGLLERSRSSALCYVFHPHKSSPASAPGNVRYLNYKESDALT